MSQLRFGIAGPGMIAGVIAEAIAQSSNAKLTAVSSRQLDNAKKFVESRPGVTAVQGIDDLLNRSDVDAVYVATPTVAKEEITLAAIRAGKHVLVDKPFASHSSVERMVQAAQKQNVVLMDATHFVHHPRTATIQAQIASRIGVPRSLHTIFYFPFSDRNNIRFNRHVEPMTALGDMAWYSMRAIVEYLRPQGSLTKVVAVTERDPETDAVIRASGLLAFDGGEVSTFDVGYTAGTISMEMQLLGKTGIISLSDFVLDWNSSFAFQNPEIKAGFSHRTGMQTPRETTFIATPAARGQEVLMIENFSKLVQSGNVTERARYVASTLKTQEYLDALWTAAN